MIIAVVLTLAVLAFLCWLLFTLAAYALPLFVGALAGQWAYGLGAGVLGAFGAGLAAAVATFVVAQVVLAFASSPVVRAMIAVVFVLPAAVAGFSAAHGLARIGVPAEAWRDVFGLVGAVAVGASAWIKLTSTWVMAPDNRHAPTGIGASSS